MHFRSALFALTVTAACLPGRASAFPQEDRTGAAPASQTAKPHIADDLREVYDVGTYRLDIELEPKRRHLKGVVAMQATTTTSKVSRVALDLVEGWQVSSVQWLEGELTYAHDLIGKPLAHEHVGDHLFIDLPEPLDAEERFGLVVRYAGLPPTPREEGGRRARQGFFWGTSADGSPRVDVACQYLGSHTWWPSKAAYYHPEDKPDRVLVSLTVPKGLTAVSVGNLVSKSKPVNGKQTWRWKLNAPVPTWAVGFAVGPYVRIDQEVYLSGLTKPTSLSFYACPENVERAKAQLATVPKILEVYSERFGEYPYPHAKLAIVDSMAASFAGATLISYGTNYPAWNTSTEPGNPKSECQADASLDTVLAHELAHIWWGQSVSASSWKDVWLHESFATYGTLLVRESLLGRQASDESLFEWQAKISSKSRIFPGESKAFSSAKALRSALWIKGPLVLNQLRHYVNDDPAWFGTLREMQSKSHLGFANTTDFIALLENHTGHDWSPYFDAWYYNSGRLRVEGTVSVLDNGLQVSVNNRCLSGEKTRVPLDLLWFEGERKRERRIWLEPGETELLVESKQRPSRVEYVNLERLLARIGVKSGDE